VKARIVGPCPAITPLGRPVVPLVNIRSAVLPACSACSRSCTRVAGTCSARAEEGLPADLAAHRQRGRARAEHDHVLQRGGPQAVEQRGVVLAEEVADDEEHPRAAAFQDVGGLGALHARVDRHQHGAGHVHAAGG
jgi:hypothetical protein